MKPSLFVFPFLCTVLLFSGCTHLSRKQASSPLKPTLEKTLAEAIQKISPLPGVVALAEIGEFADTQLDANLLNELETGGLGWRIEKNAQPTDKENLAVVVLLYEDVEKWSRSGIPMIVVVASENFSDLTHQVYTARALAEMSVRNLIDVDSLNSPRFQKQAKEQFELLWQAYGKPTIENPKFADVTISRVRQSHLIQITAESSDPLVATISANAATEAAEIFSLEEARKVHLAGIESLNVLLGVQQEDETLNNIGSNLRVVERAVEPKSPSERKLLSGITAVVIKKTAVDSDKEVQYDLRWASEK